MRRSKRIQPAAPGGSPFAGITRYLTNLQVLVRSGSESRDLVVLLHGWTGSPSVLKDLTAVVCGRSETGETAALPHADVIVPMYAGGIFSNVSCYGLAWDLVELIGAALKERRSRGGEYERVILIGHSIGALVIRKAVVFAHGETQDAPLQVRPAAQPWASKIERVILFAAMNRGWTSERRPSYMRWGTWMLLRWLEISTRRLPIAKLVRAGKKGAPFLADLRLQWLHLAQRNPSPLPATIQMLGTEDDVVDETDSADLEAAGNFTYRTLNGGGHLSIVQLSPMKYPEHKAWRDTFVQVLTAPRRDIPGDPINEPVKIDREVERVVFVMHGIRDYGEWTSGVRDQLVRLAEERGTRIVVCTSSYGYFPMGKFLLLAERERNVRWFMDQYSQAKAKYPNARFSFIGHSNGTYLLASGLRRYKTPVFDRVVFAGTVLPRRFEWDSFVDHGRVGAIQNYVATADLVVGWFPAFFEWVAELLGRRPDLGSGGHNGFLNDTARLHAIEFVRGGHAAALVPENMPNLARFALGEDVKLVMIPNKAAAAERSAVVDLGYKLCPLVWVALVAVVVAVIAAPYLFGFGSHAARFGLCWLASAILLFWLILTRI
jgi:pimeloyl-ACP methyl ester carboxylesterase